MVNYEKTKIYKIWSTQGDKVYIGSTTKDYLSQRMDKHRGDYKQWKHGKVGRVRSYDLFDEYGVENCFIELIEAKSCNNSDEKNKLEGGYIRSMECVNKVMIGRTIKEYRDDNKVKITEQTKQYGINHKIEIAERMKKYREDNKEKIKQPITCSCGSVCRKGDISKHLKTKKHINFLVHLRP